MIIRWLSTHFTNLCVHDIYVYQLIRFKVVCVCVCVNVYIYMNMYMRWICIVNLIDKQQGIKRISNNNVTQQ
jgi:hypothetical protein